MRFHKFENWRGGHTWLNLDAIHGVYEESPGRANVLLGGWTQAVKGTVDEVLALIRVTPQQAHPPIETAADRHRAAHATANDETWAKMTPGEIENVARRDELDKVQAWLDEPLVPPDNIAKYLAKRRGELGAQQQVAESDDAAELRRVVEAIRRTEQPLPADQAPWTAPLSPKRQLRQARIDELSRLEGAYRQGHFTSLQSLVAYVDQRLMEL